MLREVEREPAPLAAFHCAGDLPPVLHLLHYIIIIASPASERFSFLRVHIHSLYAVWVGLGWLALVFGISLSGCLNPYKISNSVVLSISMLVKQYLLGHWELAESAISPS